MVAINRDLIGQIVETIVRDAAPERIYLFGSRARRDAREDSDIDLLIIERRSFGSGGDRRREINRIRKLLNPYRVPADILVYSTAEAAKWADTTNHVVARAIREGRLVYERS